MQVEEEFVLFLVRREQDTSLHCIVLVPFRKNLEFRVYFWNLGVSVFQVY